MQQDMFIDTNSASSLVSLGTCLLMLTFKLINLNCVYFTLLLILLQNKSQIFQFITNLQVPVGQAK